MEEKQEKGREDKVKIFLWINELSENVMMETSPGEGRYIHISEAMRGYPESRFPGGKYPVLGQLAPIAVSTTPYLGPVTEGMKQEIAKWI